MSYYHLDKSLIYVPTFFHVKSMSTPIQKYLGKVLPLIIFFQKPLICILVTLKIYYVMQGGFNFEFILFFFPPISCLPPSFSLFHFLLRLGSALMCWQLLTLSVCNTLLIDTHLNRICRMQQKCIFKKFYPRDVSVCSKGSCNSLCSGQRIDSDHQHSAPHSRGYILQ